MADGVTISGLPLHSAPLTGAEQIVSLVGGETKRVPVSSFASTTYGGHEFATNVIGLNVMTSIVTNETADNLDVTLPEGDASINGKIKIITAELVGPVTIVATDGVGFTDIVLTSTGEGVILQYLNGWRIIGKNIG